MISHYLILHQNWILRELLSLYFPRMYYTLVNFLAFCHYCIYFGKKWSTKVTNYFDIKNARLGWHDNLWHQVQGLVNFFLSAIYEYLFFSIFNNCVADNLELSILFYHWHCSFSVNKVNNLWKYNFERSSIFFSIFYSGWGVWGERQKGPLHQFFFCNFYKHTN